MLEHRQPEVICESNESDLECKKAKKYLVNSHGELTFIYADDMDINDGNIISFYLNNEVVFNDVVSWFSEIRTI